MRDVAKLSDKQEHGAGRWSSKKLADIEVIALEANQPQP